ncbi:MAG: hypothetical protein CL927_15660 [Deltaproteobacteria bacterium]|nr:hypothetical protein [Deltaproteobacteria bacterium]HCH66079.1 hypothetical protein [Deltaproteobacteria bacterium]
MNLTLAITVLTCVIGCMVLLWMHRSRRVLELKPWEAVAKRYGLDFIREGEPHEVILRGDFRGVPVEVSLGGGHAGRPLQMCTRVFAKHVGSVPPGLEIYNRGVADKIWPGKAPEITTGNDELDALICIRGIDAEKTLEVVGNTRVWASLAKLFEFADYVRVDERGVLLEKIGVLSRDIEPWIISASSFSVMMCEVYEEAWLAFARKHGLMYLRGTHPGDRTIRGYFRGGRISIQTGVDPRTREARSTIKVSVPNVQLPAGFRIARKGQLSERGAIRVLDKQIRKQMVIHGTNSIAIQRLMRQKLLIQKLLEFFELCPEPLVERGWVMATGPGMLTGDLEIQVNAVANVAKVLSDSWQPIQKAIARSRRASAPRA